MIQLLTRNLGWKLLALLVAIGLWVSVAREPELATSLSVPVEFKNMRDELDVSGSLPDRVRLEVRGPSGRLTRENLSSVAVVLNLSDAQSGERTYNIRSSNINLPAGVVFYRAVPSQLTLRFEGLVLKDEPVQPVYVNKPPGYRVASQQFRPTSVRVRGSQDHVRAISQVKTDPIDLRGLTGEKVFHTHLNIGDPQVRLIEAPADLTVQVRLEKIANGSAR